MTLGSDSATVELVLTANGSAHERLIAELDLLGFDAFLQDDDELRAYAPFELWSPEVEEATQRVLSSLSLVTETRVRVVAPENWNERWERSVEPVVVGPFIVTPSWKRNDDRERDLIPLEIDPKMSFGTGYHATTRLMLHMLPSVMSDGARVLDAGTGTGILAIAAARLGAAHVVGIDVDPWSDRNARENCVRNGVTDVVEIQLGDVGDLVASTFDVILANIQLDVIAAFLPSLAAHLERDGDILVSGILVSQKEALAAAASRCGLHVSTTRSEAEWWAAHLRRD
ncbi:MAG: 50S ribosomal protein L11 methyltransferase [Rhodothermales bacterium]